MEAFFDISTGSVQPYRFYIENQFDIYCCVEGKYFNKKGKTKVVYYLKFELAELCITKKIIISIYWDNTPFPQEHYLGEKIYSTTAAPPGNSTSGYFVISLQD